MLRLRQIPSVDEEIGQVGSHHRKFIHGLTGNGAHQTAKQITQPEIHNIPVHPTRIPIVFLLKTGTSHNGDSGSCGDRVPIQQVPCSMNDYRTKTWAVESPAMMIHRFECFRGIT